MERGPAEPRLIFLPPVLCDDVIPAIAGQAPETGA
jgi:hypothetical protein